MRVPGAFELLDVWERGSGQSRTERALTLLASYRPDTTPDDLACLSLGERDRNLAQLRRSLFGDHVRFVAACPACGAQLESSFAVNAIPYGDERPVGAVYECSAAEHSIRFVLPTSKDLLAVVRHTSHVEAGAALLARCVVDARSPSGEFVESDRLPGTVASAVAAEMAARDPGAEVNVQLVCPACQHQWSASFDIAAFMWIEIHAWAQRLLVDVHRLARAYGWREDDVLALPGWRREAYLELCGP